MTSSRLPPALELRPAPSRLLRRYLLGVHLLALLGVGLSHLGALPLGALTLVVLASLYWSLTRRGGRGSTGLRWHAGQWQLLRGDEGEAVECRGFTVWPMLVALDMRAGHRRQPVLIMADSVPPEQFRRLRVLLFNAR